LKHDSVPHCLAPERLFVDRWLVFKLISSTQRTTNGWIVLCRNFVVTSISNNFSGAQSKKFSHVGLLQVTNVAAYLIHSTSS
jgi:hypothetical protein